MRANTTDLVKLVVNADRGEWSHLAHGTTVLLYSRGVHQYTGAFDHSMLESQLSIIVCNTYMCYPHPSVVCTESADASTLCFSSVSH